MKLSGAVSKVFMVNWCRKFKEKMRIATSDLPDFTIHLYKFYVDDHNLVVEALPPGARFVEEKVKVVVQKSFSTFEMLTDLEIRRGTYRGRHPVRYVY